MLFTFHHLHGKTLIYCFYVLFEKLLILCNIKNNGVIVLSKNPMKYLELVFVSINFKMTILLTSIS